MPVTTNVKLCEDLETDPPDLSKALLSGIQLLITANHILDKHGLVDAFGHISIRHPASSDGYIIATYNPGAPALVSSRDDFAEYWVRDSTPMNPPQPKGYSERFIHGEIYKRFPNVHCVVHSHSDSVIPLIAAGVPVRPIYHMAGFMGAEPLPLFDSGDYLRAMTSSAPDFAPSGPPGGGHARPELETTIMQDMLVKNSTIGEALANKFAKGNGPTLNSVDFPAVLQQKHGFTCVGDSIPQAVYRAYYLQKNCDLLLKSMSVIGGMSSKLEFLTSEQAEGCAKMNELTQDKAFRLWVHQTTGERYQNRELPQDLDVSGSIPTLQTSEKTAHVPSDNAASECIS